MGSPLSVVFLWHMHQPDYRDPLQNEYALPWTYLHAVKDYYDMAAIVAEVPEARAVFNFVPSLLEQLNEYASGVANDPFLRVGQMRPSDMGEKEKLFILENFFSANRQRMIEPHPRYLELFQLTASRGGRQHRVNLLNDQEILDLQVCFFLAWTGEAARRKFPVFDALLRKGKHYSEEDKEALFVAHRQLLHEIVPLYRRLMENGQVELSVSPFFHPILPLLCDMKIAHVAVPRANLPATRFRHPDDARRQVVQAIDYLRDTFGAAPAGMWPSEGSVSDEALEIIADCGIKWVATDEEVLARSLAHPLGSEKRELYRPYHFQKGKTAISMFFRDHHLSDLIGFTYSQWDPQRAVDDFVARLKRIGEKAEGGVVPVILDGENAWEYYPNNGHTFLTRLYQELARLPGGGTTTFSQVLETGRSSGTLGHIHPGSWINADFGIWVGHPEENLGWDFLERARETAANADPGVAEMLAGLEPTGESADVAMEVVKSLHAAEGSDWFWWYGDDHFSPHSDRFDKLFRRHLMNVYRLLKLDIPRELYEPIKKMTPAGLVREPAAFVSPSINGVVDDYFEWLASGLYDLTRQSSAMHAAESFLRSFFFGFDRTSFYIRLDGDKSLQILLESEDELVLYLLTDNEYRLTMTLEREEGVLFRKEGEEWQDSQFSCHWKIRHICELAVPLEAIGATAGGTIGAFVVLRRHGEEAGRWPADSPLLLPYAGHELELNNWMI